MQEDERRDADAGSEDGDKRRHRPANHREHVPANPVNLRLGIAAKGVDPATQALLDPIDPATEILLDPIDPATQALLDPIDPATQALLDPINPTNEVLLDPIDPTNEILPDVFKLIVHGLTLSIDFSVELMVQMLDLCLDSIHALLDASKATAQLADALANVTEGLKQHEGVADPLFCRRRRLSACRRLIRHGAHTSHHQSNRQSGLRAAPEVEAAVAAGLAADPGHGRPALGTCGGRLLRGPLHDDGPVGLGLRHVDHLVKRA